MIDVYMQRRTGRHELKGTGYGGIRLNNRKEFQLLSFSVVVVAKNHNPSLLNPDFLQIRKIVPEDYELAEPPLSTPVVAVVKYKQGIRIVVEMEKLQVLEAINGGFPEHLSAPLIASRYVRTLPHVRYTAVGINWSGHLEKENPGVWLRDRFLSSGPWKDKPHELVGSDILFRYQLGNVQCNLSLRSDSEVKVNANYHHEIETYPGDEVVAAVVERWSDRLGHFRTLIRDALGVEI